MNKKAPPASPPVFPISTAGLILQSGAVEKACSASKGLIPILERLASLLHEETEALSSRRPFDMDSFSTRKNQLLLELNRAGAYCAMPENDAQFKAVLMNTREALRANNRALQLHLAALEEIAGILSGVIMEADCDGTYSAALATERRRV